MNITETDVLQFLRQRADESGIPGLSISAQAKQEPMCFHNFSASVRRVDHPALCDYGFGDTIAEAIADLLPKIKSHAAFAAELRAKADRIEKGITE